MRGSMYVPVEYFAPLNEERVQYAVGMLLGH